MNEEELKKGCGKEAGFITFTDDFGNKDEDVMLCGDTTKKINGEIELFLCDTCQARLEGFQKAKNMFLEEIDKKLSNIDYSLDNLDNNEEFQDMEEYERDEYLSNLYGMRQGLQELKSKIGGEDERKNLIVREKKNDKGEIFREFSLRDEHSYMIGLNNGIEKGKLEQKKEDIKLINNLKNPYPRDVFTEPSKEQWDKLQILFEDNNLTQDRYFGSFGRLVFNNIIKQLKKEIGGDEK